MSRSLCGYTYTCTYKLNLKVNNCRKRHKSKVCTWLLLSKTTETNRWYYIMYVCTGMKIKVGHWPFSGQLSALAAHLPCLFDILQIKQDYKTMCVAT